MFHCVCNGLCSYYLLKIDIITFKREFHKCFNSCFTILWGNSIPGPTLNSHITKGYLCSFPITRTSLSRVLFNIGNYKKHPFFRAFLGNIPPTAKIFPLSRENGNTHAAPLCIRVGGGGFYSLWVFGTQDNTNENCYYIKRPRFKNRPTVTK